MATGWAKEGAVQEQIDATVKDAINLAKSRLPQGPSLSHCAECGTEIPQLRREAVPRSAALPTLSGRSRSGGGAFRRIQPSRQQGQPTTLIQTSFKSTNDDCAKTREFCSGESPHSVRNRPPSTDR